MVSTLHAPPLGSWLRAFADRLVVGATVFQGDDVHGWTVNVGL